MDAIALAWSDVPLVLIDQYLLERWVHERGGEREIRFWRQARGALLPVWHDGQLRMVPWGCMSGRWPRSGLTWRQTVEDGTWATYGAHSVDIRATAGCDGGVWYRIRQGIQGLLVEHNSEAAAYIIVEPASYYYKIMTRRERMPLLIGERI